MPPRMTRFAYIPIHLRTSIAILMRLPIQCMQSLTNLLSTHAYYDRNASTVASKAERTSADILKHALMDVVSGGLVAPPVPVPPEPVAKGGKGKGKATAPPAPVSASVSLNRYRLFFLLNGNTLASMCREVLEFMHDVESKVIIHYFFAVPCLALKISCHIQVLPVPTLAGSTAQGHIAAAPAPAPVPIASASSSSSSSKGHAPAAVRSPEKEWTAEDKRTKGPYATPAKAPQSQVQSQLPSQSQSQLMTQGGYMCKNVLCGKSCIEVILHVVASPAPQSPTPVAPKAAIAAEPPPRTTRSTRSAATAPAPVQSTSSGSVAKAAAKRPPVTEAFTQLSDVEESSEEEEEEEEERPRGKAKSATSGVVNNSEVIDRLRAATSDFAKVMAPKDPLLAALAAAPAPIVSKAAPAPATSGRVTRSSSLRSEEGPSSPATTPKGQAVSTKVTSHAPSSAAKKAVAPSPKKSLHATRKSAEKVNSVCFHILIIVALSCA
jgi:hypothetical protein